MYVRVVVDVLPRCCCFTLLLRSFKVPVPWDQHRCSSPRLQAIGGCEELFKARRAMVEARLGGLAGGGGELGAEELADCLKGAVTMVPSQCIDSPSQSMQVGLSLCSMYCHASQVYM